MTGNSSQTPLPGSAGDNDGSGIRAIPPKALDEACSPHGFEELRETRNRAERNQLLGNAWDELASIKYEQPPTADNGRVFDALERRPLGAALAIALGLGAGLATAVQTGLLVRARPEFQVTDAVGRMLPAVGWLVLFLYATRRQSWRSPFWYFCVIGFASAIACGPSSRFVLWLVDHVLWPALSRATPGAAAVYAVISGTALYVFRKKMRFLYGTTEALVGVLVSAFKFSHTYHEWSLESGLALLCAGTYLVVRGAVNMEEGLTQMRRPPPSLFASVLGGHSPV